MSTRKHIQAIHISFPVAVELTNDDMRMIDNIAGEICDRYQAAHPGRVCWPAGCGDKIISMPMTAQDDEDGVPIVFDGTTFQIDCCEREDFDWPCSKCEYTQGDHVGCITDPPAGDCVFEPKENSSARPKSRGLVAMHVYESAVRGRREMRQALKEARANSIDAEQVRDLVLAAREAVHTLRIYHGLQLPKEVEPSVWAAYQKSPEMQRINAALAWFSHIKEEA